MDFKSIAVWLHSRSFEGFPEIFLLSLSCSLLKGRDSDGFPVYEEKFIRECIRKFPYCDATLLQQLVRSIAPVDIVSLGDLLKGNLNWVRASSRCWTGLWCLSFRGMTPQLCLCWLRPSRVRWASWTQSSVRRVETKEPRRDVPSVKWWESKLQQLSQLIREISLYKTKVKKSDNLDFPINFFRSFLLY